MNHFFFALIFCFFFSSWSESFSVPSDPEAFIDSLGREAVERLTQKGANEEDFVELLERGFDVEKILCQIVTEEVWQSPTIAKEKLLALYKKSLARAYLKQFKRYGRGATLTVVRSVPKGENIFFVESTLQTKKSLISIGWTVKHYPPAQWKIMDVFVEGVSLIDNQQEQYRSTIKGNPANVAKLIQELEAKNQQLQGKNHE